MINTAGFRTIGARIATGILMLGGSVQVQAQDHAPPPAPPTQVSTERLLATIRSLPTRRAAWGDEAHFQGLIQTQDVLIAQLHDLGYEPDTQEVAFLGRRAQESEPTPHDAENQTHPSSPPNPLRNIFVDLKGRESPTEVLLVSAHIDAVPGVPGADDDGSGIAAIMEAARLLKDAPMKRTLRLALFNLEEVGLVGSSQYAADVSTRIAAGTERLVGMVSIDMIGYFSHEPQSQKWPFQVPGVELPTTADFIAIGGILKHTQAFSRPWADAMEKHASGLKVFRGDFLPVAPPDLLRSDHAPFLAMGVPAIILADTANFRSPHYHKSTDTIDTLDKDQLTLVVKGVVGAAWEICGPVQNQPEKEN